MMAPTILIVGAGPTGLGAAYRLQELRHANFMLLEKNDAPGGLASSRVDANGFTWDIGGHVQFSHYTYYDEMTDKAVPQWLHHKREAWIWIKGRFVPYPFQNNLGYLDESDCAKCLHGLEETRISATKGTGNFGEWIDRTFGAGIADIFLRPYNLKVWGYPLETMGTGWMGERVAVPDLEAIKKSVREKKPDADWGPNRTFRFPARGGTGAIWSGVAKLLPPDRIQYGKNVRSIDVKTRTVDCEDGSRYDFDYMISSLPIDRLCRMIKGMDPALLDQGSRFVHSSVYVIGLGLRGPLPSSLAKKTWMYFPEKNSPYYRATVFSNYSPAHVPAPGMWSLLLEVCDSPKKPMEAARLREWILKAVKEDGLVPADAELVSYWQQYEPYGYPTPFLGRDQILDRLLPELEKSGIFSRGRFGAWKYEVSNQDHSAMQGVEAVDRILLGKPELTVYFPDKANAGGKR